MDRRSYTAFDHLIATFDQALRTVFGQPQITGRPNPADALAEPELTHTERLEAGRLMRVNHAGEVCAQALYQGQALTARHQKVRDSMQQAAREENDHLDWCDRRIRDLDSHRSYLNPAWYAGSFALGALAGAIGDKWSLGYVAETERQVVDHIDAHLSRLPEADSKSRAILEQMKEDEGRHGTMALAAGGAQLPRFVTHLMRLGSRVMTGTTYWI